jgi:hypothetical protein
VGLYTPNENRIFIVWSISSGYWPVLQDVPTANGQYKFILEIKNFKKISVYPPRLQIGWSLECDFLFFHREKGSKKSYRLGLDRKRTEKNKEIEQFRRITVAQFEI